MRLLQVSALWASVVPCVLALYGVQNTTFNATHGPFNPETARARVAQVANLSADTVESVLGLLDFERTNWAGTSVKLDPFYADLPADWESLPAGSIIKVEEKTDTTLYTMVPSVAMSRILYTTRNFNGTLLPASAFVLWPYMPRKFPDCGYTDGRLPIIAWAHGTSGWNGECGPSHIRNQWYQFMITAAATRGHVVVAPDFAGLGLDHDGKGNIIPHQYLAAKAAGYDLIYAAKAAQRAWPDRLDDRYAVLGHSQGGNAAWGAAIALAEDGPEADELRKGYRGSVPMSPFAGLSLTRPSNILANIGIGVKAIFPTFELSDWITEQGVELVNMFQDLGACYFAAGAATSGVSIVRPDWNSTWYADAWRKLTTPAGKAIYGPMLIVTGTADPTVTAESIGNAINETCEAHPDASIEYVTLEGVGHNPAMSAGQDTFIEWIGDRFRGKRVDEGCLKRDESPMFPVENYEADGNWLLVWATS